MTTHSTTMAIIAHVPKCVHYMFNNPPPPQQWQAGLNGRVRHRGWRPLSMFFLLPFLYTLLNDFITRLYDSILLPTPRTINKEQGLRCRTRDDDRDASMFFFSFYFFSTKCLLTFRTTKMTMNNHHHHHHKHQNEHTGLRHRCILSPRYVSFSIFLLLYVVIR